MALEKLLAMGQHKHLSWEQVLQLHAYMDNTFRLIVFVYGVALAVMAFARLKDFKEVVLVASALIVLVLAYALYVVVEVTRILRHQVGYSKMNSAFYYIATILFGILFFLIALRFGDLIATGPAGPA